MSHTVALAALLVLATAPDAAAGALGDWLSVQDPIERCQALVVLNGDHARVDEVARLFREGVGREVWLTNDPRSGDGDGDDLGTRSNAERLAARGVPKSAIHIVPGAAIGTRAELDVVAADARRRQVACVVLVTSPVHGRRVSVTWRHLTGGAPRAVLRHAAAAHYAGWRAELRELGLTILALIGLPR